MLTLYMCDACGSLSKTRPKIVEIELTLPLRTPFRQVARVERAICKTCESAVDQKPLEFKTKAKIGFQREPNDV